MLADAIVLKKKMKTFIRLAVSRIHINHIKNTKNAHYYGKFKTPYLFPLGIVWYNFTVVVHKNLRN